MEFGRDFCSELERKSVTLLGGEWTEEHEAKLAEKMDEIFNRSLERKIGNYLKKAKAKLE